MKRSLATRLLHALLAAAIIHQLVGSGLMHMPRPSGRPGDLAFGLHEFAGLASLGLLAVFWLWILVRRGEHSVAGLVPWFSPERRAGVIADLRLHLGELARLRLPHPSAESPLASATHGFGLIVASVMATTGALVYAQMGADGSMSAVAGLALDLHSLVANLMWAYLIGHASIAVLHQLSGHNILQRMFST
jgi:cytochrome b561